jgi:hypothetical protein
MSIELHIEELVLHGFDPRDRHAIADAVQQELARIVADRGLDSLRQSAEVPRLDAGTIDLDATRGAAAGAPIAGAIHSTLNPAR